MTAPNEELAAKFSRVQHAVSMIRVRAEVSGVTVESDGNGRLTALSFTPQVLAVGPEALADLLLAAHRNAVDDAVARANDLLAELSDDPVINRLAAMTDAELATHRPTSQAAAPGPSHRPPPTSPATYSTPQWEVPPPPVPAAPAPAGGSLAYRAAERKAARLALAQAEEARRLAEEDELEDRRRRGW